MLQEFVGWVSDEYFANNAKDASSGQSADAGDRAALAAKVTEAQTALKGLAAAKLPATAKAGDLDELRTRWLAALAKSNLTWTVDPKELKDKLGRFTAADADATLREVKAGTFEGKLKQVKARVSSKTHIEIRGCNIGKNDAYLNGIREFFGSAPAALPSISAPMLYQFFGMPGAVVLPQGKGQPDLAKSLKFLFEEKFDDKSTAAKVDTAIKKAGLQRVSQLADLLRYADVRAEFERWWQMKRKAAGAPAPIAAATLKDFQDFITTGKTFPVNTPGAGATSLWYLVLIPSTAIATLIAWVKDQGYALPNGEDMIKRFAGGSTTWDPARFQQAQTDILVDWLGDDYPVPKQIYFPEDPTYKASIKRLP
jgi:hypothetical protein